MLNIVNHILKNRRYIGEYRYRDVVQPDAIPAIVPKELFERVQEHRQRLIDSFVNAVYLYDDKLIITFNYKDSAKTVSLEI